MLNENKIVAAVLDMLNAMGDKERLEYLKKLGYEIDLTSESEEVLFDITKEKTGITGDKLYSPDVMLPKNGQKVKAYWGKSFNTKSFYSEPIISEVVYYNGSWYYDIVSSMGISGNKALNFIPLAEPDFWSYISGSNKYVKSDKNLDRKKDRLKPFCGNKWYFLDEKLPKEKEIVLCYWKNGITSTDYGIYKNGRWYGFKNRVMYSYVELLPEHDFIHVIEPYQWCSADI